jgi:hypothetical protein
VTEPERAPEHPTVAFRRLQQIRDVEQAAFIPSSVIERLVLQVMGGWENVISEVNFHRFAAASADGDWVDETRLAKAIRELAEESNVRWPHDQWSKVAHHAGNVRKRLAHMLYIDSTTGEYPNRTLTFIRQGKPADSYRSPKGAPPAGLSWRDRNWCQQTRHKDSITEQELRGTLDDLRWMILCCRLMMRYRDIFHAVPDIPDDHVFTATRPPWWLPEWGDPATTDVTVGHIRIERRASTWPQNDQRTWPS